MIVLAQLAALKTQKDIDMRLKIKFSLTRKLYDRGLDRDTILNLYKFIDWVLTLPKELGIHYNEYLHQIEEEHTVAYITTAERIGMEKGYEQGVEKGLTYERALLKSLLTRRFGHLSSNTISTLEQADHDTLLSWGEKILDAKTIKDVFGE